MHDMPGVLVLGRRACSYVDKTLKHRKQWGVYNQMVKTHRNLQHYLNLHFISQ